MSNPDKSEIIEELEHHKEMLRLLRRRLRELERKDAQYGINVPVEIKTEIYDLTERIQRHESELTKYLAESVVSKETLAETEYRMLVTKAWNNQRGLLSVVDKTRVEYHRVRLGIPQGRAENIEMTARSELALEYITNNRTRIRFYSLLRGKDRKDKQSFINVYEDGEAVEMLHNLEPALHLHMSSVIDYAVARLSSLNENSMVIHIDDLRIKLRESMDVLDRRIILYVKFCEDLCLALENLMKRDLDD